MDRQEMPATKAWRPTSVVEERDRPKTLSSRRSHRKKKNRRGSGMLNRSKVKLIRKHNRKWRWRNKRRIRLQKRQEKALSPASEPPGMSIPDNGIISPESETRKDLDAGSMDLDLTAKTDGMDRVENADETQYGTKIPPEGTPAEDGYPPPQEKGGAATATPRSSTRTRKAKHANYSHKLKWFKQIGGHLNYTDNARCPQGPIKLTGPRYTYRRDAPSRQAKKMEKQQSGIHSTETVTESTSLTRMEGRHHGNAPTFDLMGTAQGCPGSSINLQKPVKDDLPYHHISPVQGESDGEARAADSSDEHDGRASEGSTEEITSKTTDKSPDDFFKNELPPTHITHHLKLGKEPEEHFITLPAHPGNPLISPDEEGIMNVSAEIKYSTTYDARRKQFINYKSRRQPYVLCQIQEFRPEGGIEGFKPRKVRVGKFLADTGAQINVGNLTLLDLIGIPRSEYHARTRDASHMRVHGIGGVNVPSLRALDVMIHSLKTKQTIPATFFLSDTLTANILSETLVYELGYIQKSAFKESFLCTYEGQDVDELQRDFIEQAGKIMFGTEHIAPVRIQSNRITKGNVNSGAKRNLSEKLKDFCANTQRIDKTGNITCDCPRRTDELPPFNTINDMIKVARRTFNIAPDAAEWPEDAKKKMLEILHGMFQATAFNTCTTQELPTMKVPEMKISLRSENAKPTNVMTPYNIPVSFKNLANEELKAAARMGIIEPVPAGETSDWCAPMMTVGKKAGGVRIVTNFRGLNKWCNRAPHPTQDTLRQVLSIPAISQEEKKKGKKLFFSSLDAWNGYHSIPVHKDSRHYLTFTTEFGRYRYKVAPQGFLGSGDHYTQTTNEIFIREIDEINKRTPPGQKKIWQCPVIPQTSIPMKRCIDDTLTWAGTYEDSLRQVWSLLYWGAKSGIIFNPDKVEIGKKSIKAFGFRLDETGIHPTKEMKAAISGFELPQTLKQMRAFMGLIAQVGWTLDTGTRDLMYELRGKLRGKKKALGWTNYEKDVFTRLKIAAANAMEQGIERMINERIMDKPGTPLVLTSDWSAQGTGFQLHSVTCGCRKKNSNTFKRNCCPDGWKLIYAGGRFNSPAESKYAPIEGELLGIAIALHKSRYLVQGNDNLTVLTDHKPLVGFLGKLIDTEMENRRMQNLRRKTQNYNFVIQHVPGATIGATDGISRRTPQGEPIPDKEWTEMNKVEVTDTQSYSGGWFTDCKGC